MSPENCVFLDRTRLYFLSLFSVAIQSAFGAQPAAATPMSTQLQDQQRRDQCLS